ncbi:MAG TPA: rhomboid family intramembrane serine protease [Acidobacteriaceae bacterium]|nr:rhomboid family intramembrane serine protease [Acidobacteriaceae bacterium]
MDAFSEADRRPSPQPEILPPGSWEPPRPVEEPRGWYPPPQPPPRPPRRHWAHAPATYWLVGINCAVYLLTLFQSQSLVGPSFQDHLSEALLLNGGLVLGYGQWWRVVSSMFTHFGWIHIGTNMWCLWNLGLLGEPLIGEFGMIAAYLLTGAAGNLLSIAVHPQIPGAGGIWSGGASGAVFGIAGVLLMVLRSPLLPIPPAETKRLRRAVWQFALINFIIDAGIWVAHTRLQIDNMAHLGGFLSGIVFGLPLLPRIGAPRSAFLRRRTFTVVAVSFALLLFAWWLRSFYAHAAG